MKQLIKKAIIYRLIIMTTQFIFLYFVTGKVEIAIGTTITFAALATIIHVLFEMLCNYVDRK